MSSNSIYPHVPYFYIIRHIPSGKYYAGSKYAKDANPNILMKIDGYKTSSNIIKDLITTDGIESFEKILVLQESECHMHVHDYETIFLQTWDIANDNVWFNRHNNTIAHNPPGGHTYYTKERNQKISKAQKGRIKTKDECRKISDGLKRNCDISGAKNKNAKNWILTSPDNKVHMLNGNLVSFCEEQNIAFTTLRNDIDTIIPEISSKFRDNGNPSNRQKRINTTGWKLSIIP